MRRLILFFLTAISLFLPQKISAQELNAEAITRFSAEITINQDTSISIKETINYFTPVEKHGIYRYIPEKYRREGWIATNPISEISVTDRLGESMPFTILRENGNVTLKIGDPDKTFSGERDYVISYKVASAITRQDGFDELYWDITGEGWSFPILSSDTSIKSAFAEVNQMKCLTGTVGGSEENCRVLWEHDRAEANTEEEINYGENFTVALKLNKNNQLIFPTRTNRIVSWIKNNGILSLLILPGLLMFFYWHKKGRDYRFDSPNVFDMDPKAPQKMRPLFEPINIPLVYEPLKNLTPGKAGTLYDERSDNQDVIAEIVDLARKKYLSIKKVEKSGFLQFGHDYIFIKEKESVEKLPAQQKYLMDHIFGSKKEKRISELKGTFYNHMSKVKELLNKELTENKYFSTNPSTARALGIGAAIFLDIAVFIATINTTVFLEETWPVFIYLMSTIAAFWFGWNMPQKTALGTNLSLQARGLKETIRLGKWREEIKEKHLFIEEVLPLAISLGVINKLVKDMKALNIAPPKYFSGGFTNTVAWSGFVSDFSKTASGGLSYNPSSSSSSGSGFSGGSSGGGGGGGGGGSW